MRGIETGLRLAAAAGAIVGPVYSVSADATPNGYGDQDKAVHRTVGNLQGTDPRLRFPEQVEPDDNIESNPERLSYDDENRLSKIQELEDSIIITKNSGETKEIRKIRAAYIFRENENLTLNPPLGVFDNGNREDWDISFAVSGIFESFEYTQVEVGEDRRLIDAYILTIDLPSQDGGVYQINAIFPATRDGERKFSLSSDGRSNSYSVNEDELTKHLNADSQIVMYVFKPGTGEALRQAFIDAGVECASDCMDGAAFMDEYADSISDLEKLTQGILPVDGAEVNVAIMGTIVVKDSMKLG